MDEAKNQINDLEHKEVKNHHSEQELKIIQKNEDSVISVQDNFKYCNIHIIEMPKGKENEQGIGNVFEKYNERKLP